MQHLAGVIIISLLLFITGGRRGNSRVQSHAQAVSSLMKVKRPSLHGLLNEGLNGLLRDISLKKQAMSGCDSPMPDSPQLHFPSPPGERLQEHCLLEQGHPLPRPLEEHLEK